MNLADIITKGATDRSVVVRIIDSTDGTPETGVVFNTAGIDLWYRREGAAKVSITEATLASLTTAHSDGGFLHISDGAYRLDMPDAAFATGANYVDYGGTVTGMVVIGGRVKLIDANFEDAAAFGLTNVDAAISTRATPAQVNTEADTAIADAALATAANLAAAKTVVDAIKLKTDNLPATPAAAGDAMTLTSGERTAVANVIEAEIIDDTDTEKVLTAITNKIAAANPDLSGLTLAAIAAQVRTELATELARIDAAISTRLATAGYTAPDNASASAAAASASTAATQAANAATDAAAVKVVTDKLADTLEDDAGTFRFTTNSLEQAPTGGSAPTVGQIADQVRIELATELARVDTTISSRLASASYTAPDNATIGTAAAAAVTAASEAAGANTKAGAIQTILAGITSLAQWLGLIAGKQTGDTTARTELRATGAGSGTYDETTDSAQAIRDRGDAAWTGSGGGGSSTVVIGPVAATVRDVAIAASTGGVIQPLTMFKAQRATIIFAIVDGNEDPVDITGDALSFVIHDADGTQIAEINSTNEAAQFVVGDSGAVGATGDQLTLTIEPTENNQTPGDYEYKLWDTTLDAVLATGKYRIRHAPQS